MEDFVYEDISLNSDHRNVSMGIFMERRIFAAPRIDIYESKAFGRCLYLDGSLQTTEKDEHIYHECIAQIPMLNHPAPKSVLIIGGGDGGTLREVLLHKTVERAVLCEINTDIIPACKEYMPRMELDKSLKDPRVSVVIADGAQYILGIEQDKKFDVVIVDCSDPSPESSVLYTREFLRNIRDKALAEDGYFAIQSCNAFTRGKFVYNLGYELDRIFNAARYFYAPIQSFPCGGVGFYFASNNKTNFECPLYSPQHSDHKYLNSQTLSAGFNMKPAELLMNKRQNGFKWYCQNEFDWVKAIGMQDFHGGAIQLLGFHKEPRKFERMFTLMSFNHKIEKDFIVGRSLTLFTFENEDRLKDSINSFVKSKGIEVEMGILNGVTWHSSGDFELHALRSINEAKAKHPMFIKQKPTSTYDQVIMSYVFSKEGVLKHSYLKFFDLNTEQGLTATGRYTREKVRNNSDLWKQKLTKMGIAEIEKFEKQGLTLDSVSFKNRNEFELSFEVPYETP